jgi:hypothetical protein
MKHSRVALIWVLGAMCTVVLDVASSVATAQVPVWFRSDFNNLNQTGSNLYNFANRYPQSTSTWQTSHTTQGWKGSGAPRVVIHGCSGGAGCNFSEHQFNAGWVTPSLGGTRNLGDSAFVRFRIKFDPNTTFPPDTVNAKFIMFGRTGVSPNSRWIIHLLTPKDNQGCTLGFDSYSHMGWTPPSGTWWRASHWGFPSDFNQSPITGRYASLSSHVNIEWSCAPAVLLTAPTHPAPIPKPQANGAAPSDGWYHLQFQATSGNAGSADFRIWANNNDQTRPSSEHLNMADGLGVTGWNGPVDVVGYWGTNMPGTVNFVIDDFEIGPSFDPAWYPGASASPPSTVPLPPSDVEVN